MTVTIDELKNNMCRWPIGDPQNENFCFCGEKKTNLERPYCDEHTAMARRPDYRKKTK